MGGNKCVLLGSTLYGVNPKSNAVRFSKAAGKKGAVTCQILLTNIKHMGGVDKANALVDTKQSKTVVFPNVCLLLDVCVVNAWIVYRQDCSALNQKYKPLKRFRLEISRSLAQTGKTARKGRPSLLAIESDSRIKYP
nr:unnamed protein product [Callosobruchus chinensis]